MLAQVELVSVTLGLLINLAEADANVRQQLRQLQLSSSAGYCQAFGLCNVASPQSGQVLQQGWSDVVALLCQLMQV